MSQDYDHRSNDVLIGELCEHGTTRLLESVPAFDAASLNRAAGAVYSACRGIEIKGAVPTIISITESLRWAGSLETVGGLDKLLPGNHAPQVVADAADSLMRHHRTAEAKRLCRLRIENRIDDAELVERLAPLTEATSGKPREPRIRFFRPSEIVDYVPEPGTCLVGNNAILRGEVFVIGGEPGVGKSTAGTELAICGAQGRDWLGLTTHRKFRTLIIQNENGRYRLQQEYAARGLGAEIEENILVSEPPPFGMTLNHPEFLEDVEAAVQNFRPDVLLFDPWNAAAKDDKAKDYAAAFDALRAMLPKGKDKPALGIVAHTKKPQSGEKRTGGSGLMHLLSGSYVLSSVPRSVFIMLRGSTEETDNSIVWANCKNNNGPLAPRTAWEREPSGFTLIPDFDWETFDGGEGGRKLIRPEHIKNALGDGKWERAAAVERLEKESGCGKRACQKALHEKSPFAAHLVFDGKWIGLKTEEEEA